MKKIFDDLSKMSSQEVCACGAPRQRAQHHTTSPAREISTRRMEISNSVRKANRNNRGDISSAGKHERPLLHRRRAGLRRTTKNTAGKLTGRMVSSVRPMVTTERDAPSAAARTPRLAARARERPAAAVLRLAARSDMVGVGNGDASRPSRLRVESYTYVSSFASRASPLVGRGFFGGNLPLHTQYVIRSTQLQNKSATSR